MIERRRLLKMATCCLAVVSVVAYLAAGAQAEVVIDYNANDGLPQAAGWSLTSTVPCTGAIVDDAGTTALCVIDPTTASGKVWSYRWASALTSEQVQEATDVGFSLNATLRVEDMIASGYDEMPAMAFQIALSDLGVWYVLALGQDANGDTTYLLKGGTNLSTVVTGTISGSGYHAYDLRYSPVAGSADLFVDGIETVSNLVSSSTLANRIRWGAEDSAGMGAGYWTDLSFETSPRHWSLSHRLSCCCLWQPVCCLFGSEFVNHKMVHVIAPDSSMRWIR